MKFELSFLRNRDLLIVFIGTILINFSALILILFFLVKRKLNIILHYNILFGVEFKGSVGQVFVLPLIGLIIFALNTIIANLVYRRESFIAYLLLSASLASQIFVVIAIAAIIMINSNSVY